MKRRENNVRVRFSTIVFCILGLLLCSSTSGWANDYDGGIYNITADENYLNIGITVPGTTVNLYANISTYVVVGSGSFLNIYSGNVGTYIAVDPGPPSAVVTVYGTDFGGDGDFSVPGQVTFSSGSGTLTGNYGDGSDINLWFLSDTPIYLETPGTNVEQVEIDIKPGSYPNTINQGSNGLVPVAIFSSPEFDATQIEPTSVSLAGANVAVRGKGKSMAHEEDVNGDGLLDLVVQVETQGLDGLGTGGTVELTGTTFSGEDIVGYDEVIIVPPDK